METPLDEVRERIGLWPSERERTARAESGRCLSQELSSRTRWSLAGTAVAAAVVAITHGFVVAGLADAISGPWSVARTVVSWPSPPAQQVLAAVAGVTLVTIAMATEGHKRVSRRLSWPLRAATVAAILGAGPLALVCTVALAVGVLIIVIAIAVLVAVIAMLAS
jgi:hypothetical protein